MGYNPRFVVAPQLAVHSAYERECWNCARIRVHRSASQAINCIIHRFEITCVFKKILFSFFFASAVRKSQDKAYKREASPCFRSRLLEGYVLRSVCRCTVPVIRRRTFLHSHWLLLYIDQKKFNIFYLELTFIF